MAPAGGFQEAEFDEPARRSDERAAGLCLNEAASRLLLPRSDDCRTRRIGRARQEVSLNVSGAVLLNVELDETASRRRELVGRARKLPKREGSLLFGRGSSPSGEGSLLFGRGSCPSDEGSLLVGRGSSPSGEGSLLVEPGSSPNGEGSLLVEPGSFPSA